MALVVAAGVTAAVVHGIGDFFPGGFDFIRGPDRDRGGMSMLARVPRSRATKDMDLGTHRPTPS